LAISFSDIRAALADGDALTLVEILAVRADRSKAPHDLRPGGESLLPAMVPWDFVWDFTPAHGAWPLVSLSRRCGKKWAIAGRSCDGETRTRTGDTTIFREPPRTPLRHETPANR